MFRGDTDAHESVDDFETRRILGMHEADALELGVGSRPATLQETFNRFDTNGDGLLNAEEIMRGLKDLRLGFSPKDIAEVIRIASKGDKVRREETERRDREGGRERGRDMCVAVGKITSVSV